MKSLSKGKVMMGAFGFMPIFLGMNMVGFAATQQLVFGGGGTGTIRDVSQVGQTYSVPARFSGSTSGR